MTFREKLVVVGAGCRLDRRTHNRLSLPWVFKFPLLQKSADTCMGNIENEDSTACGVERKLIHPGGMAVSTANLIRHVAEMAYK